LFTSIYSVIGRIDVILNEGVDLGCWEVKNLVLF